MNYSLTRNICKLDIGELEKKKKVLISNYNKLNDRENVLLFSLFDRGQTTCGESQLEKE